MKYKTDHLTAKQHRTQAQGQSASMKAKHKDFSVFLRVFTQKRQHHDHSRFSVVRSALKNSMLDGKFVAVMYELLRANFQKYNVLSHRRLRFQKMREKLLCCCIKWACLILKKGNLCQALGQYRRVDEKSGRATITRASEKRHVCLTLGARR